MQIDVFVVGWDGDSASHSDSDVDADAIDTMWMAESGIVDGFVFLDPVPRICYKAICWSYRNFGHAAAFRYCSSPVSRELQR